MQQKENQENLLRVIERIGDDSKDPSKSIRVLARYVSNLPGDFPLNTKSTSNLQRNLLNKIGKGQ